MPSKDPKRSKAYGLQVGTFKVRERERGGYICTYICIIYIYMNLDLDLDYNLYI